MINTELQQKDKKLNKELITLYEMMDGARESISILQNAFIYHNSKLLQEGRRNISLIRKQGDFFGNDAVAYLTDNPDWMPYRPIPGNVMNIVNGVEQLTVHIGKKIDENILFSDKAIRESIFLIQRLIEIMAPAADIILARNAFLAIYIEESQIGISKMALDYATLHEDRLIKGICNASASSAYLGMLDAIKSIAWHSKEIAVRLTAL